MKEFNIKELIDWIDKEIEKAENMSRNMSEFGDKGYTLMGIINALGMVKYHINQMMNNSEVSK